MKVYDDDPPIIGTPRFAEYQKLYAEAGRQAVMETLQMGIPVTRGSVDGRIIKEWPDGHTECLGTYPPSTPWEGPLKTRIPDAD
jgi:hypothetical protein